MSSRLSSFADVGEEHFRDVENQDGGCLQSHRSTFTTYIYIYDNTGKDHISRIVLNKCDAGALETAYIVMHQLCGL